MESKYVSALEVTGNYLTFTFPARSVWTSAATKQERVV